MKKILFIACIGCILAGFVSCKEQNGAADEITIYGNVIDKATGYPLYNVLIQEKNKVGGSTVTGNDGNYEFTLPLNGSSKGRYYLVASKDQYISEEYELILSNVDKKRHVRVDFQLSPGNIIYTGRVVDEYNMPIADAVVDAQAQKGGLLGSTYTDANGQYTLKTPPVQHTGYINWWNDIVAYKPGYHTSYRSVSHTDDDIGRTYTFNFILYKEDE